MLPDQSPSSLLAETWSQCIFVLNWIHYYIKGNMLDHYVVKANITFQ